MSTKVNYNIAITHIVTRKRQTLVAALGVTIGVAIYLFMNSLSSGFSKYSRDEVFKNNAHLKIYKSDEICKPLRQGTDSNFQVILNPQISTLSKTIINPAVLLEKIKKEPYITNAVENVDFSCFYNRGKTQLKGSGLGVNMNEYAEMYSTEKYMVAGNTRLLQGNLNGIVIGKGIAEKLSLGINENITLTSSYNVTKVLRIVGIFSTGNILTDDSKCYVNISTAQQFLRQGSSYITTIFANTPDPDKTEKYVQELQTLTPYTVEDWKTTNADILAADKTRSTMMGAISLSILLVAAFGIYNILSATISQKINDIAILKAIGFSGGDVIKIFVTEAFVMGTIGTVFGLGFGSLLIAILQKVYVGGAIGYFPIHFEWLLYARSFVLGLFITLCAGYFPAKKAAGVDPVSIFRK